jgi:hypothetical protein
MHWNLLSVLYIFTHIADFLNPYHSVTIIHFGLVSVGPETISLSDAVLSSIFLQTTSAPSIGSIAQVVIKEIYGSHGRSWQSISVSMVNIDKLTILTFVLRLITMCLVNGYRHFAGPAATSMSSILHTSVLVQWEN